MRGRRPRVLLLLAALLVGGGAAPLPAQESTSPQRAGVQALAWFVGCWRSADGTEELWTDGRGGQMLGLSRTFRDGRAFRWEFLRVYEGRRGPIYSAAPSHQPPAEFAASVVTPDSAVFLNPDHDFPTGLTYVRLGGDSILVRVFGPSEAGSGLQGFETRYGRRPCDEPGPGGF